MEITEAAAVNMQFHTYLNHPDSPCHPVSLRCKHLYNWQHTPSNQPQTTNVALLLPMLPPLLLPLLLLLLQGEEGVLQPVAVHAVSGAWQ